ncbi:hypothetical protein BN2476_750172 [Paraburkholderia piptadeniae]|uniref:Uncharacterized protein n=1 Tax=Paraburkholderia piptadeniae TaxID=1701573 RepID=A0A1N7SS05_9BURK|nr:hypothetical protein BN2476_750172 [Paraburkholderia piptadeniae]
MSSPYVVAFIWALLTSSDWLNFHFGTSMPLVKREPRTNPQDPVQRILRSGHSDIDVVARISVKGCVAGCPRAGGGSPLSTMTTARRWATRMAGL